MKIRERKTLNKPLLRDLAAKLRRLRHEEHYNQGRWIEKTDCGTAACIAGHVVLMAGARPCPPEDDPLEGGGIVEQCRFGNGGPVSIEEAAGKLLGIKDPFGTWLFSAEPEDEWPDYFRARWRAARIGLSGERPSRIAADLLDALADGKITLDEN